MSSEGFDAVKFGLDALNLYLKHTGQPPLEGDGKPEVKSAFDTQQGGSHYKDFPIQPTEYCHKNRLPWCESNIVKYVSRHAKKNGIEDLKKARHYLDFLIEMDYPDESKRI